MLQTSLKEQAHQFPLFLLCRKQTPVDYISDWGGINQSLALPSVSKVQGSFFNVFPINSVPFS